MMKIRDLFLVITSVVGRIISVGWMVVMRWIISSSITRHIMTAMRRARILAVFHEFEERKGVITNEA